MTTPLLTRVDLAGLSPAERRRLTRRSPVPDPEVAERAAAICRRVASEGDAAVTELAGRFGGGWRPVEPRRSEAALTGLDPAVRTALEQAIENVHEFHAAQLPTATTVTTAPGVEITRAWQPLSRIGAYVPGGKAVYPSTAIMTVVPARVAGVEDVVVVSPEGPDGALNPVLLAACRLAGATEVWAGGGAQAIAALAYGTETMKPVSKIVGPGNPYVTAAKLVAQGVCAIDMPAGPSEALVLADAQSDPVLVAVDLLCQTEHGVDSPAVLVTTEPGLIQQVEAELARLLPTLERAQILAKALADHGLAVVAESHASAISFANEYAPEHVSIMTADPESDATTVTSAGSIYVGTWAPESAGDYATGANHVLPTGGLAVSYGPLSTQDFGSWRQIQRITRSGLENLAPVITTLAEAEGLTAHRLAAQIRLEREEQR
jgi:histidinol dehydrogenase